MYLRGVGQPIEVHTRIIGRITDNPIDEGMERADHILLVGNEGVPAPEQCVGYAGFLSSKEPHSLPQAPAPGVYGIRQLGYLTTGDVVLLLPGGSVNVLYRRSSLHNTILTTERCNSLCLMCSQPPRLEDDSYRVEEILRLIELIDPLSAEIGLSGGEPTLLGTHFLKIVEKFRDFLPCTRLHILTNGRLFKDLPFARALGRIGHPALMLGIPLYSDIDWMHDYVVQAPGAFDETVQGLYNLAGCGVRIEIRVVVHAQTHQRLPQLADYVSWNLPFVDHVALMGMEMFGFVHRNLATLWIDPVDYQAELERTTLTLAMRGFDVSIYNHQLCTLPKSLWPFARKSISDWKNVYLDACHDCGVRDFCGGFFQSGTKKHSRAIRAQSTPSKELAQALQSLQPAREDLEPV